VPCASKCSGTFSRSLSQSERRNLSERAWSRWFQHAVHIHHDWLGRISSQL
jgi:hypothetical protein